MAKEPTITVQIGVSPEGRLPLPWLGVPLAAAAALAGAHALLIHGPAGAGHLELGLLLAQATLCEAALPRRSGAEGLERPEVQDGLAGGPGRPCGRCASCHLVATRVHPDLLLVIPDALRVHLSWVDDEDSKLHKADAKPSRDIRVEQVRQAIAWSQQTSGRGRGKVMLVHPADALNGPAANALLKTLEEPPGMMRLLLTSADPERLLPTVRSRCQRLPLALPPLATAEAWLREQGLAEPAALLAVAAGSPLEALAWAREGMTPVALAELPRRVAAGDASVLAGRSVSRAVDLLLKLSHDAQVMAAGGALRFFSAGAMPAPVDAKALHGWQQALLRAARHDEHPWNAGLLIESLVTQAMAVWPKPKTQMAPRGAASLNSAR